jgi:hypothetical protein
VSATPDIISVPQLALLVLHVLLTPTGMLTEHALAIQGLLIILELVRNALKEPCGVQQLINASMSAVKTQPIVLLSDPVFVILDMDYMEDRAKSALIIISFPVDTVSLAQSIPTTIPQPRTVIA